MNIQSKFFLLLVLFSAVPFAINGLLTMDNLRNNIYDEKREALEREVDIAISIITLYANKAKTVEMNTTEAQNAALEIIQNLRHGPESLDYFWIHTYNNLGNESEIIMLMDPFSTELVGQNIANFTDPSGKHIFVEMNEKIKSSTSHSGFVSYKWQYYDDETKIAPKLSFVKSFANWNWVIGTGFYIEDIESRIIDQFLFGLGIFAGFLVVIIFLGFIFSRGISKPIVEISKANQELSKGVLSQKIVLKQSKDEIGSLIESYSNLYDFLKLMVLEIKNVSSQLADSSQTLASSAEEVNASSEEISAISQQMNQGAVKQTKLTDATNVEVKKLGRLFNDQIVNIERSTNLISSISKKVNILALNASIEAARAGEYGKGFAVVAENIRSLSAETHSALSVITNSIEDLQKTITGAIKIITDSIGSVAEVSDENLASAEETSAATQEQTAIMEEITSSTQELANYATKLEALVNKFKV